MRETQTKVCSKCGEEKALTEFRKHKKGKYGVTAECKVCEAAYHKAHRAAHKEEIAAYHKAHRATYGEKLKHDLVLRLTGKPWSGEPFHCHHRNKEGRGEDCTSTGRKLGGVHLYRAALRYCDEHGDEAGRLRYSIEFPGDHKLKHAYKRQIEQKEAEIAALKAQLSKQTPTPKTTRRRPRDERTISMFI